MEPGSGLARRGLTPGFDLAAHYSPFLEIGCDFYDVALLVVRSPQDPPRGR